MVMFYNSSHSPMGNHLDNYQYHTWDLLCNDCPYHNPLHSLHIFRLFCYNMIYLLMLKQCILHLRVRDNHIEISWDSKSLTHKMYLMDLMVDLMVMLYNNSHSSMGNHLDNYQCHTWDLICNDCPYHNPLHSLHIFQLFCYSMIYLLVLKQCILHLKVRDK